MKVKLAYGRTGLEVELPDEGVSVIEPRYVPGLADEQGAMREALANPIGAPALADLVKPHHKVAITFPDVTRPCPTDRMLPAILEAISIVPRENVVLISGTGMHRPNTDEEMRRIVGPGICERYRVIDHNAFDKSTLALAGVTSRGTEVWVNEDFLRADVKILVGFIEPHVFAGFSGGGKAILPGIAGEASVLSNHDVDMIGHPRSTWGITRGNPIFEEIREAALLANPTFLCNVTLNRERQITNVFYGDLVAAHDAVVQFARETAMRPVESLFDVVVTTNGGYPLDQNLYQTLKGISAANSIVREGGSIVVASECSDGIPDHGNYGKMLRWRDHPAGFLEMLREPPFPMFDQWVIQIQAAVQMRAQLHLYSSLADEVVRTAHMHPVHDIQSAVRELVNKHGGQARIAILPEGPFTIPYVQDEAGKSFENLAAHGV